jgi:signal transduction histidine kinase
MTDVKGQIEATENAWQIDQIVDAAMQTMNNRRCRKAYLHDLRGGLQAVSSSLELLSRSARKEATDSGMIEKAAALAKRALMNHEIELLEMLDQLVADDDEHKTANAAAVVEDVCRFLRAEAADRDIGLTIVGDRTLQIHMPPIRLRRLLLELITLLIDESPPGADLLLGISRSVEHACLEIGSPPGFAVDHAAEPVPVPSGSVLPRAHWVLASAGRGLLKLGGRLEITPSTDSIRGMVRIYCPLSCA